MVLCAVQGGLQNELRDVIPHIASAVQVDDIRQKSEALTLLRYIVELHTMQQLSPYIQSITQSVVKTVNSSYTKVKSDGIRTCASVAVAISNDENYQQYKDLIYE